ncbi:MAG: glycosyltransferase family 4 protein [Patescibacteria group bacterium]|jgi:glycosyltransferase involved in cell wall biosynthesis
MKLIYITNSRLPTEKAHGHQIVKMCSEFAAAGADVTLLWPTRKNPITQDVVSYYNLKNNFTLRQINSSDFIQFDRYLKKFSYLLQSLFFLSKLYFLTLDKDAVIYTRKPEIAWLFKIKGYKVVFESHEWFGKSKNVALKLIKNADKIIVTNNYLKHEFVKNFFEDKKILVCPHGVDKELFDLNISKEQALKKLDLVNLVDKKILLYTGSFKTMGQDKGLKEILHALQILSDKSLFFIAVGGTEQSIKEYQALADLLGVGEQVKLLPHVSQASLGYFQKAADALLMPFPNKAHYKYFMAPLKMFEYLAATKPIIATDLPSIREILTDETAWFCKPSDPQDLAKVITQVFNNQESAEKKAQAAHELSFSFSWQARAKKIIEFIFHDR